MDEGTTAIYAVGGSVTVEGNVTATGINGTAISASKWDLIEPTAGAFVMVDGKITAYTPLRIESLPGAKMSIPAKQPCLVIISIQTEQTPFGLMRSLSFPQIQMPNHPVSFPIRKMRP
jgi:hypothetical protein